MDPHSINYYKEILSNPEHKEMFYNSLLDHFNRSLESENNWIGAKLFRALFYYIPGSKIVEDGKANSLQSTFIYDSNEKKFVIKDIVSHNVALIPDYRRPWNTVQSTIYHPILNNIKRLFTLSPNKPSSNINDVFKILFGDLNLTKAIGLTETFICLHSIDKLKIKLQADSRYNEMKEKFIKVKFILRK